MSADTDEQELLAALGFSSFGAAQRSRKRARRSPHSPAGKYPPLVQLAPGTELGDALPKDFPQSTRAIPGPHGVLYLVKGPQYEGKALERALCAQLEGDTRATETLDEREKSERRSAELLERLQHAKTRFDALDSEQFRAARSASNAFERIGRHRFLNRSAMKLATLDHVFQWTKRATESSSSAGPFAFADICGGPGGFSEYLLWRLQQRKRTGNKHVDDSTASSDASKIDGRKPKKLTHIDGFGITLRDAANRCDWRLPSDLARVVTSDGTSDTKDSATLAAADVADSESAATFTVCYGADGTGDVYSLANVRRFRDVVHERHPSGVLLAVADGGFLDARDRANQVLNTFRVDR